MGFYVDGVGCCLRVHEADEYAQAEPEHGGAGAPEGRGGGDGGVKGTLALLCEFNHFDEEDDILAVELHARGVDLEAVVVAVEASVEGVHGVHLAAFFGALGGGSGF